MNDFDDVGDGGGMALPFVAGTSFWSVPAMEDYALAYEQGVEFAERSCEWLETNQELRGGNTLLAILSDMAPTLPREAPNRGYAAGFCGKLECMLQANPRPE